MTARRIGQRVIVYDDRGVYLFRGFIVGAHRCSPPFYDVQPDGDDRSMRGRKFGIPPERLRSAGPEPSDPVHVKDLA